MSISDITALHIQTGGVQFGSVFDRQLEIAVIERCLQILRRQQIDGEAEQHLFPAIVVFGKKSVKYPTFLHLFGIIRAERRRVLGQDQMPGFPEPHECGERQ